MFTVQKVLDKMEGSNYAMGKRIKFANAQGNWWDNLDREVKTLEITNTSLIFTIK